MIYAFVIAFFASVIIALLLIHRDTKRLAEQYEKTLQKHHADLKRIK